MGDKLEYFKVWLLSFISGIHRLLMPSTWQWMAFTKQENNFTWPCVIGIVLFGDYRRHVHLNKYDSY